jgi:uncharacterized RDD family membrane protein YckC
MSPPDHPIQLETARLREVLTPEGVPVHLQVALVGDRFGALLFDLLWIAFGVLVFTGLAWLAAASGYLSSDAVGAVALLASFLVRTFFFAFFELKWQGQTPGKRRFRLRVVDARGGPLSAEAVIARNLTREVELFMPVVALSAAEVLFPGMPGWARLGAVAWMLAFGLLPLIHRDGLRVGDLIAGTIVVRTPDVLLLGDLSRPQPARAEPALQFTPAQTSAYGEYELQVLEQLLRQPDAPGHGRQLRTVADQIRKRIGWKGRVDDERFLREFYAALRARLEKDLLLGKRRRDKHG